MVQGKSKHKKASASSKSKHQSKPNNNAPTWVDQLRFLPTTTTTTPNPNNDLTISVISWNILAESYCRPRSHPGLPRQYREIVFEPDRRGSLIRQILLNENLRPDVWALQEVDLDEILTKHLPSVGYEGVETPRMKLGGGAGGKVDSCGIYYLSEKWTLLDQELIRLDDLATLVTDDGTIPSINNNLRGLQQSFLRRNVGILCRLQSKTHPETTVVVANAHLFWNPLYQYVKLCQMHYIMMKAKAFLKTPDEPFLLCGDLNSLPQNSVHVYLSQGAVNARPVAPWYQLGGMDEKSDKSSNDTSLSEDLSYLTISKEKVFEPQVRYLLDFNLNRLCRWFRILGVDCGLETEEEERLRTKESDIRIFHRCQMENRVLVTSSSSLLARQNCPPGTYLITPKSLANNWEIVLVHILLTHGVYLDPKKFLTRCVVCNGNICSVKDPELKKKIFTDHQAPTEGTDDVDVFQCDACHQGYWFSDRPQSSSNRVLGQATRLFQMCLRGDVPVVSKIEKHAFEHVNIEEERQLGWDWSLKGSELLKLRLQVTEWLRQNPLECPMPTLQSAYKEENGESIPYTNVTRDFEGCLDYIFFEKRCFQQTERLYVPKSHEELNSLQVAGGHLLPSSAWPSDHLAIGATFRLKTHSS